MRNTTAQDVPGWRAALLLALVLLPLFVNLASPPLWDGSEPFYAETAREMVVSGDWWVLHYNLEPRWEKPPLPIWLLAASYRIFGVSEWAARFPIALAAAFIPLLVYMLGAHLDSRCVGLLAAATTGTAFKFFGFARQYAGDVFLALSFAAALYLFSRWEQSNGLRRGNLRAAWVVVGLGALVKGPVGVLPVVVGFAYLWARRHLRLMNWGIVLEGAALVLLVAVPWYAYQLGRFGWEYVRVFLLEQNLARLVSERLGARPPWFYVPALLADTLPWSLVLALAVGDWLWRGKKSCWRESPILFPAVWFLVVFLFFSFARGKRDVYLLPLYPALGLLVGSYLNTALARDQRTVLAATTSCLALFALAIAVVGGLVWQWLGSDWGIFLGIVGLLGAVTLIICAVKRHWVWAWLASVLLLVISLTTTALALTHLSAYRPIPYFSKIIQQQAQTNDRVATYLADLPSLMFYTQRRIEPCWTREEFAATLESSARVFAVMPDWVYQVAHIDFGQYRWQVLTERPYLQLTSIDLRWLRTRQIGTPLLLVRIESRPAQDSSKAYPRTSTPASSSKKRITAE